MWTKVHSCISSLYYIMLTGLEVPSGYCRMYLLFVYSFSGRTDVDLWVEEVGPWVLCLRRWLDR